MIRLAMVVLLLLAGCSAEGQRSDEQVETDRVLLVKSYRFEPANIKVSAGTTVTWANEDNFVHNVHVLDGVTRDLPIGADASITFEEPGTVRYECSLHPSQMKGSVIVTEV